MNKPFFLLLAGGLLMTTPAWAAEGEWDQARTAHERGDYAAAEKHYLAAAKAANDELVKLEKTGEAAKIYDVWFGPSTKTPQPRAFTIEAK